MNELETILAEVRSGALGIKEASAKIEEQYFKDLGHSTIDNHRERRVGYPEVVYCAGKTPEQVEHIISYMYQRKSNILATRAEQQVFDRIRSLYPEAEYNALARTIVIRKKPPEKTATYIAVVTAGTSDAPVAEEAFVTAELFGNRVEKVVDVGVAGIHRLFHKLDVLRNAKVLIVVAGMEGALASVVAGLVDKPIIAVPTSVGYGTSFGGLAALLSMLNSCAGGISVVNIDNGFGAGYLASMINKL